MRHPENRTPYRIESRDYPAVRGGRKGDWHESLDIPFMFGFGHIHAPDRNVIFRKALDDYRDNAEIRRRFDEDGIDRVYEVRVREGHRTLATWRTTMSNMLTRNM